MQVLFPLAAVVADAGTWVLPPSRALWIPAGVPHETIASERSTMRTLYLEADTCPIQWKSPRPVVATALLVALIEHLEHNGLDPQHRVRAEQLTFDLLEPVDVATIQLTMPTDERHGAARDHAPTKSRIRSSRSSGVLRWPDMSSTRTIAPGTWAASQAP